MLNGLANRKFDDIALQAMIALEMGMGMRHVSSAALYATKPVAPQRPAITDEEAVALARTTVNLFRRWRLNDAEACSVLGGMAKPTWLRWKNGVIGSPRNIEHELRRRMAILMNIHMGLRALFDDPELGYAWIRNPKRILDGKTPLDIMRRGEIENLIEVRDWLYASCQIW